MHLVTAATVPASSDAQLIIAAVVAIAVVIVLITWLKVHPFLALIFGTATLGVVAGLGVTKTIDSFTTGVGTTVGTVGLLIALGAMIGGLLADSGGADRIVDAVVGRVRPRPLPWAMAGVAALVGLPLFFEVGVVLLVPVIVLVSQRSRVNLLKIGIPALAGLSVLHGLVPPHPGPLVAISALKADLGTTLAFGLLIAIPTVILAGPVFGNLISRYVVVEAPSNVFAEHEMATAGAPARRSRPRIGDEPAERTARRRTRRPAALPGVRRTGGPRRDRTASARRRRHGHDGAAPGVPHAGAGHRRGRARPGQQAEPRARRRRHPDRRAAGGSRVRDVRPRRQGRHGPPPDLGVARRGAAAASPASCSSSPPAAGSSRPWSTPAWARWWATPPRASTCPCSFWVG